MKSNFHSKKSKKIRVQKLDEGYILEMDGKKSAVATEKQLRADIDEEFLQLTARLTNQDSRVESFEINMGFEENPAEPTSQDSGLQPGLDWSRPQLVNSNGLIVQTAGIHESASVSYPHFEGIVVDKINGRISEYEIGFYSKTWNKDSFIYHGEIKSKEIDWSRPQLVIQKINRRVIRTTGVHSGDFFSGTVVDAGNDGCFNIGEEGPIWDKAYYIYYGEIEKKPVLTGMNFLEAVAKCEPRESIKRQGWKESLYLSDRFAFLINKLTAIFTEDLLATDWIIVKP